MLESFRKFVKKGLPFLVVLMVAGLILSRVYSPERAAVPEPEATITAMQAAEFEGKVVEVCGFVAGVTHRPDIGGSPTFINFEDEHPNQVFTAVIWGDYRNAWRTTPAENYLNRTICVTGRISMHEGTPQINLRTPEQVRIR